MDNLLSQREVLDLVTSISYQILKCGGEINRVEDTATRIAFAYGMDYVHVFAITASIVITMEKDGVSMTQTRRIKQVSTNLDRLDQYNALSRKICEAPLPYREALSALAAIENRPCYPSWLIALAFGLIGGSFSVFFGGDALDFCIGFVIGVLIRFVMLLCIALQSPPFIINVAGSAATVLFTKLLSLLFPTIHSDLIIIGVLMNLVPGVLLVNCIRDFVATDYTAGTAKVVETLFTATAIALGVGVSVFWR